MQNIVSDKWYWVVEWQGHFSIWLWRRISKDRSNGLSLFSSPSLPDFKAKVAKWGGSVENLIPCTMPDENSGGRKPLSPNGWCLHRTSQGLRMLSQVMVYFEVKWLKLSYIKIIVTKNESWCIYPRRRARKPNKQRQPLIQNQRQPLSIQIQRQRRVECSLNGCWGSSRCRRARPACQPAPRRCEKKNQGRSSTGQAGWGGIIC